MLDGRLDGANFHKFTFTIKVRALNKPMQDKGTYFDTNKPTGIIIMRIRLVWGWSARTAGKNH